MANAASSMKAVNKSASESGEITIQPWSGTRVFSISRVKTKVQTQSDERIIAPRTTP